MASATSLMVLYLPGYKERERVCVCDEEKIKKTADTTMFTIPYQNFHMKFLVTDANRVVLE